MGVSRLVSEVGATTRRGSGERRRLREERSRRAVAAAAALARDSGLRVEEPTVLGDLFSLMVYLRPAPVVARVATCMPKLRTPISEWLGLEIAVTTYLSEQGAPVVAPSPELPPGPHEYDGFAISFWTYLRPDPDRVPTAADCSAMLVDLHGALRSYQGELPMLGANDIPRGLEALDRADDILSEADVGLLRASVGGAVARAFAREGAHVFLAGRTLATLEEVAEEIRSAGGVAETAEVDALDEETVEKHADAVAGKAGGIDILFNAIGMQDVQGKPLHEMSLENFAHPITVATRTQFLTARAVARLMIGQDSGVILTITAGPARRAFPTSAPDDASSARRGSSAERAMLHPDGRRSRLGQREEVKETLHHRPLTLYLDVPRANRLLEAAPLIHQSSKSSRIRRLDDRVRLLRAPALYLEAAIPMDHSTKPLLPKPQLTGSLKPLSSLRVKHGAQRENKRVNSQPGIAGPGRRACAPPPKRDDDRLELLTPRGKLIDPGSRRRSELSPPHYSSPLELPEALGEDVGAGIGKACSEVCEALGTEKQLAHYKQSPPLSDEVEGVGSGASLGVSAHANHLLGKSITSSPKLHFFECSSESTGSYLGLLSYDPTRHCNRGEE